MHSCHRCTTFSKAAASNYIRCWCSYTRTSPLTTASSDKRLTICALLADQRRESRSGRDPSCRTGDQEIPIWVPELSPQLHTVHKIWYCRATEAATVVSCEIKSVTCAELRSAMWYWQLYQAFENGQAVNLASQKKVCLIFSMFSSSASLQQMCSTASYIRTTVCSEFISMGSYLAQTFRKRCQSYITLKANPCKQTAVFNKSFSGGQPTFRRPTPSPSSRRWDLTVFRSTAASVPIPGTGSIHKSPFLTSLWNAIILATCLEAVSATVLTRQPVCHCLPVSIVLVSSFGIQV